jgi:hypothetical protein
MSPKYDYEMLDQVVKLIEEYTLPLRETEDVEVTIQYPSLAENRQPNRSVIVYLERPGLDAELGVWSGGTGDVSAFDFSKKEHLFYYHYEIESAEDVVPHLNKIISLFRPENQNRHKRELCFKALRILSSILKASAAAP